MTTGLVLRSARPADAPVLGPIEAAADQLFADADHPEFAGLPSIDVEEAERAIEAGQVTVAEVDGIVVGWALVERHGSTANLGQLCVHPRAGRRGIGTALVDAVVAAARAAGAATMTLDTQADVPWNAPWYERLGFEAVDPTAWTDSMRRTAEQQAELGLDWSTRVFMRRPL